MCIRDRRYPSDWLARLAVDLDCQRRSLGCSLPQDVIRRSLAVAEHAGIRALLTQPLDAQADAFYRRFGFESLPQGERHLILLLKDCLLYTSRCV